MMHPYYPALNRDQVIDKMKALPPHSRERAQWEGVLRMMTCIELGAQKPVYRVKAGKREKNEAA